MRDAVCNAHDEPAVRFDEHAVRQFPMYARSIDTTNPPMQPLQQGTCPYFRGAFFFPAIERRGPLRVRALVLVRWPRTGNPRR